MNDYENQGFLKRNAVWIVVLVAVIIFGFLLFKGWDKVVNEQVDKMITITGSFSCLPLKPGVTLDVPDIANVNTDTNCVLGVRTKDNSNYALDISHIQDANTDLRAEDTIAVTGFVLAATEVLGTQWEGYDVIGIIKVNTLLRTR